MYKGIVLLLLIFIPFLSASEVDSSTKQICLPTKTWIELVKEDRDVQSVKQINETYKVLYDLCATKGEFKVMLKGKKKIILCRPMEQI